MIIILETRGILDSGAIENLASRVREMMCNTNNLPVITCAASLAHQGLLGSVQFMWLGDVDLTSVPAAYLASLASSVTGCVSIDKVTGCRRVSILDNVKSNMLNIARNLVQGIESRVEHMRLYDVDLTLVPPEHLTSSVMESASGCDLVTVLDSVKSGVLVISNQSLCSEETKALVRAMESRVERVELCEEVTLDIRILIEYNGQGKCRVVECHFDTVSRYRERLRTWAKSRNWVVHISEE